MFRGMVLPAAPVKSIFMSKLTRNLLCPPIRPCQLGKRFLDRFIGSSPRFVGVDAGALHSGVKKSDIDVGP